MSEPGCWPSRNRITKTTRFVPWKYSRRPAIYGRRHEIFLRRCGGWTSGGSIAFTPSPVTSRASAWRSWTGCGVAQRLVIRTVASSNPKRCPSASSDAPFTVQPVRPCTYMVLHSIQHLGTANFQLSGAMYLLSNCDCLFTIQPSINLEPTLQSQEGRRGTDGPIALAA